MQVYPISVQEPVYRYSWAMCMLDTTTVYFVLTHQLQVYLTWPVYVHQEMITFAPPFHAHSLWFVIAYTSTGRSWGADQTPKFVVQKFAEFIIFYILIAYMNYRNLKNFVFKILIFTSKICTHKLSVKFKLTKFPTSPCVVRIDRSDTKQMDYGHSRSTAIWGSNSQRPWLVCRRGEKNQALVGHLPQKISKVYLLFLWWGGILECTVTAVLSVSCVLHM